MPGPQVRDELRGARESKTPQERRTDRQAIRPQQLKHPVARPSQVHIEQKVEGERQAPPGQQEQQIGRVSHSRERVGGERLASQDLGIPQGRLVVTG
jgi:hypothetical protein